MRCVTAIIAAICLTSAAAEAQTSATFSYVNAADNIDLAAQVLGSLSGNHFTITGVSDRTLNGQAVAFTPAYDDGFLFADGDTYAHLVLRHLASSARGTSLKSNPPED